MTSICKTIAFFVTIIVIITGCNSEQKTLFILKEKEYTGIDFSNTISESDSFNIFEYDYIYNGGGVAVSDFNNDGLQDIFFTGNMVDNRLYLNKGKLQFQDVTEVSNVNLKGRWNSGVTVVDINNDGWQDIYVCATMKSDSLLRANMLFVNKGLNSDSIPVFEEEAEKYGIADTGFSVMSAFFDYDRDGDLDLYVLTNQHSEVVASNYRLKVSNGSSPTNDRLYKNNGDGSFTNVTKEAGIVFEGYGLGLAISDFNDDGWQDIYVSNDFITNDILYLNNQDGTFSNRCSEFFPHQSLFSMGSDASDFNNDGLIDLVTMDMMPETNQRKKTMIHNKSYQTYINNEKYKYDYQHMRNMLHLNMGLADSIAFSEIGLLSGVAQTEWSWSPLFADFDNDGFKDLLITNGFPKDITDRDFIAYKDDVGAYITRKQMLDSVPVVRIPNYAFRNSGTLSFEDVSKKWGITQPSFSNGAAYADLDNDGDLDYIVNNINEEAFVYENTLNNTSNVNHFLRIKLKGSKGNAQGVGAKLTLFTDSAKVLTAEQQIARGYLSAVDPVIHFGLGKSTRIDSLVIRWPDGKYQTLLNIKPDQLITVVYDEAKITERSAPVKRKPLFKETGSSVKLLFRHTEKDFIDYNVQRTLPHKFSQSGPGISVGDIDGDGLDDMVIGGSKGTPTSYMLQRKDGTFSNQLEIQNITDKTYEDEGLLLFDADNDKDLDLYIVSGSVESEITSDDYRDKLFRNDNGRFTLDTTALPKIYASGSCVRASDFDADGDLDLFVGGRVVPARYPLPAESYLLRNDNGKFVNVTSQMCAELQSAGLVTDALFTDMDNDGKIDLLTVGEFMSISIYKNTGSGYTKMTDTGMEELVGWWNSIVGGDFDNDGDIDYLAGNLGLNNGYMACSANPLEVYAKDFDNNGSIDQILACFSKESISNEERKLYPVHFWDELSSQSPRFRKQFSRYKEFSKATITDLLSEADLKDALYIKANYFESSYIQNLGDGKFKVTPLAQIAQAAPVNGMIVDDFNNDGNLDALLVGNDFGNEVFVGRYDAFGGLLLAGDGKGNFVTVSSSESGFYVPGDAKALVKLSMPKNDIYIASRNNETVRVFEKAVLSNNEFVFSPEPQDTYIEFYFKDGHRQKSECYYGSGYLSQSTRKIRVPKNIVRLVVVDSKGKSKEIDLKSLMP